MYLANALLAIGIATHVRVLAHDRRHESMVRFLDWTLMNDEPGWSRVLDEKVKGLEQPPYADEFASNGAEIVPRSAVDGELFSARPIVTNVAYYHSMVGSFVRYAVAVLQKSFMCFVAKHLAFQMQCVSLLLQLDAHAAIMTVAGELKDHLVQIIDKLAVAEIDLSLALRTYWQTIVIMQYDVASQVRMDPLPESVKQTVERLHGQFVDYRTNHCSGYELSLEFFDDIGIKVENTLIVENVLNTTLTEQELTDVSRAHSKFLKRFFMDLNYNTMPTTMWTQVFYSSTRGEPIDELDKINPPINKQATDGGVGQTHA